MNQKRKKVEDLVSTFASLANLNDPGMIEHFVDELSKLDDDAIVYECVRRIFRLYEEKMLKYDDIVANADKILAINPGKYKSINDLIGVLNEMKDMNTLDQKMPLKENHKLVLETFDKVNGLLEGEGLDCYHTGGLMCYMITDTPLVRNHGDLDIMVNEQDLLELKKLVDKSEDFTFESHMEGKGEHGHEFAIRYKNTPMTIGLFLFERGKDGSVSNKSYHYDKDGKMMCIEERHTPKFSKLSYDDTVRSRNGITYRMLSLSHIYANKSAYDSRPKDKTDARLIEHLVDKNESEEIRREQKFDTRGYYEVKSGPVLALDAQLRQMQQNVKKS